MVDSSISWLDFSEAERRKMIEIVALFKERDTRDELGIASIRDRSVDLFFPGTTGGSIDSQWVGCVRFWTHRLAGRTHQHQGAPTRVFGNLHSPQSISRISSPTVEPQLSA